MKNILVALTALFFLNSCGSSTNSSSSTVTGCSSPDDLYCGSTGPGAIQDLPVGTERPGPGGATLTLAFASGSRGYKIWKEKNGSRILNASGLLANGWQQKLTRAGTGFTRTDFTSAADIAGRVCPANVFLSHDNMIATGRCLFYDSGDTIQDLDAAAGTEAQDWLTNWDRVLTGKGTDSSYYEGNVKVCADKGMRLPTMYETTMNKPSSHLPGGDIVSHDMITWAGSSNGVPSVGSGDTWTASARSPLVTVFWAWNGTTNVDNQLGYQSNLAVRCVLP